MIEYLFQNKLVSNSQTEDYQKNVLSSLAGLIRFYSRRFTQRSNRWAIFECPCRDTKREVRLPEKTTDG